MVLINGHPLKPSYEVKVGDLLHLNFPNKNLQIKVLSLEEKVNKEDAGSMYEVLA
jgi:ribosomal 50S subunit-recycling heat shock protein